MARRRTPHDCVEAIYRARDLAIEALEVERYGEALRLLAQITEYRARIFPVRSVRRPTMTHIAETLRQLCNLMDDLSIDSDVDEELDNV